MASLRAAQAREVAAEAGFSDEVGDVLADAAAGVAARYTVTYDVGGATLRVAQHPPRRRIDSSAPGRADERVLTAPGGTLSCTREARGWVCEESDPPAPPGAFSPADVQGTIDALVAGDGAPGAVRVERVDVAGVAARCLVSATSEFCVSAEGVPLVMRGLGGGGDELRAVSYEPRVADGAFDRPDR